MAGVTALAIGGTEAKAHPFSGPPSPDLENDEMYAFGCCF